MHRFLLAMFLILFSVVAPVYAQSTVSLLLDERADDGSGGVVLPDPDALEGPIREEEYVLGPGDELEIGLWKEMDRREKVRITPEGIGLVRPAGPVPLAGLTLMEGKERIRAALASFYRPEDVTVSLTRLRSFAVHLSGQVERPGVYEVSAADRVSKVIAGAGGLLENASNRNIRLVHRDGGSERVDLTAYRNTGDLTTNPVMKDGDVVQVPVLKRKVSLFGSVGRPGLYELVEGERLGTVLALAGGVLDGTDPAQVEIHRFGEEGPTGSRGVYIGLDEAEDTSASGYLLRDGDRVFFRKLRDWQRDTAVELAGEFQRPGRYVITEGEDRVLDVIRRAGGITSRAAPEEAKLLRTLFDDSGPGVEKEVRFLVEEKSDGMTPEDYEFVKTYLREDTSRLVIDLEALFLEADSTENHFLREGDMIILPTRLDMIRVSGRVKSPGLVAFAPAEEYKYYIEHAGGFDRAADRGKVRIIKRRSGARLKPASEMWIEPGDMIWVPPKEERDWWLFTREVFTVAAQVATLYLVIDNTRK